MDGYEEEKWCDESMGIYLYYIYYIYMQVKNAIYISIHLSIVYIIYMIRRGSHSLSQPFAH